MYSQEIEPLNAIYYRYKEKSSQHQGFKDMGYHRRNYSIYIKEKVLFTMTMKIKDEPYLSLLTYFLNKIFNGHNFRTRHLSFSHIPFPIQIFPW